ncbi:periplasmic nitrate reductase, NapE protein [Paracoccus aestuariivivens]|uniref:periplasmic nitrate reductase, NapE protein n=1 Tax=Paracoccus aestuariivivens TaxID=1820333 RepID=UPI0024836855|nr:periplasmic nitrate reductase, NapE protein [Paracoccus aestuariivivens]
MPDARYDTQDTSVTSGQRIRELAVFILLAFAIWPILSVAFVGAYGFIIWIYQIFTGPPGPPMHGH